MLTVGAGMPRTVTQLWQGVGAPPSRFSLPHHGDVIEAHANVESHKRRQQLWPHGAAIGWLIVHTCQPRHQRPQDGACSRAAGAAGAVLVRRRQAPPLLPRHLMACGLACMPSGR